VVEAVPAGLTPAARRWRAALLVLAALLTLLSLWALLHAPRALDASRAGSYLMKLGAPDAQGWWRVSELLPGSPLLGAGVKVGDQIHFRHTTDVPGWRALDTQETVQIAVRPADDGGSGRTLSINPVPNPEFRTGRALFSYLTGWTARFISLALGVLIVLRRPESVPLRGLALALICSSGFGAYFLPGGTLHDAVELGLRRVTDPAWALGLLWFALRYPQEAPLWSRPLARLLFAGILLLHLAHSALTLGDGLGGWSAAGTWLWNLLVGATWWPRVYLASQLATLGAMLVSTWRADGATRTRLAWVSLAMCGLQGANLTMGLLESTAWWPKLIPWQFAITDVSWLLGAVLLVWAVLRHRAFDFGVVMQRTVAVSVVSTALLTALGLGKWVTERLLHDAGVPRGLWADLLVALVVVGTFAMVQKRLVVWVDARVFRRWHEAAEALRAFVDRAAQVTEPALLQQRFVDAVDAFAAARGCALYAATQQGALQLVHATLPGAPAVLDTNDLLAIELRHGARRVDLTRLSSSAAAACVEWAFVMSVRGRISGALLISPRPDGVAYRPEELAQLEDSARRIGLDLESLRVAELERGHEALQRELAEMRRTLHDAPTAPASPPAR
jgi:hypothetical protein